MLVGDCNGDGVLNADDLACITTIEERDAVLGELNTLPGDLDGDGSVAFPDFLTLSTNFNTDLPGYQDGNIDLAGGIEFADFLILSTNFNKTPVGSGCSRARGLCTVGLARRRGARWPTPSSSLVLRKPIFCRERGNWT